MMSSEAGASSRTVLLVEDTAQSAAAFELALLTIANLSVRVVSTAEDALAEIEKSSFAALITDINLPRMSGLELVARVRNQLLLSRLPVIVISGDPAPDVPANALTAGANAFFAKPCSPLAVRRKLEELLNEN